MHNHLVRMYLSSLSNWRDGREEDITCCAGQAMFLDPNFFPLSEKRIPNVFTVLHCAERNQSQNLQQSSRGRGRERAIKAGKI